MCTLHSGSLQALGVQGVADAHTLSLAPKTDMAQAAHQRETPAGLSRPVGHRIEPGILSQLMTQESREKRSKSQKQGVPWLVSAAGSRNCRELTQACRRRLSHLKSRLPKQPTSISKPKRPECPTHARSTSHALPASVLGLRTLRGL